MSNFQQTKHLQAFGNWNVFHFLWKDEVWRDLIIDTHIFIPRDIEMIYDMLRYFLRYDIRWNKLCLCKVI